MDVEFIGMIATREYSEIHPPQGPAIDLDYVRRFAQAHECSGIDRILIGYFGNGPDGFIVASYAALATERIGLMLAHRPGFVAPTLAAHKLATLDHFSGGRLAVHIISGGDDAEQQEGGDFLDHRARYARTDEYVGILKRVWTSAAPIDHDGAYYRFRSAYSEVKPLSCTCQSTSAVLRTRQSTSLAGMRTFTRYGESRLTRRLRRSQKFELRRHVVSGASDSVFRCVRFWRQLKRKRGSAPTTSAKRSPRSAEMGCLARPTGLRRMSVHSVCSRRRPAARC